MATDTSTTNFAPKGFIVVERLGIGSVFEVAVVRGQGDRDLVCKRPAPHVRSAVALERERDVLEAAKSRHFPEVIASGSDARGVFLVQTRARGAAVRELVRQDAPPLDARRWLELARSSSRALADLHALADADGDLSVVHGDISPDNLFFEPPNTVTFVDFSSATWRGAARPALAGDRGTVPYAAPELLRQEGPANAACDTYALAATLLAAAVGPPLLRATTEAGRLFEAANQGVRWSRIEERADLPASARSAVARALQHDRAERLGRSRQFAEKLADLEDDAG